jgi:hypothetical protein
MPRRRVAPDVLLALAAGVAMQLELFFVEAPSREVLITRAAVLALAVALLVRRRLPVLAGDELEAGPRPGGGFEVDARLPLDRSHAGVVT